MKEQKQGLELLRKPFESHQISKLPKPTKKQTDEVKTDHKKGTRCKLCEGWHHPDVVHLDYVGHAALTDRLLDADPKWYWEPLSFDEKGLPRFDVNGGLWIRLHVAGHSRLGYGNAATSTMKEVGSREKEVIGDALRNAAMRFGAALDLWHKGDLHLDDEDDKPRSKDPEKTHTVEPNTDQVVPRVPQKPLAGPQKIKTMPINGKMYQNLIIKVKGIEAGWQKVEAYTKTNFAKSPKLLTIQEYEQVMSIITAGAL